MRMTCMIYVWPHGKLMVIIKYVKSVIMHMYNWLTAHIHRGKHNVSRSLTIIVYHNGNCSRWGKNFENPLLILLCQPIPHEYLPNSIYLATNDSEIPRKHLPTCHSNGGTRHPQSYIALSTYIFYTSSWRQQVPNYPLIFPVVRGHWPLHSCSSCESLSQSFLGHLLCPSTDNQVSAMTKLPIVFIWE